jgi:Tfp pilus assembly protein PilZ
MEKRKFQRVNLVSLIDYFGENKAKSKDISENGICIVCDRIFARGTPLLLTIPLNGKCIVHAIAKSVWSKENASCSFENGLVFYSIGIGDREKIVKYIEELVRAGIDRRSKTRRVAEIVVNYSIKAEAMTKNVTHKGMCLSTKSELQVGKIVLIVVTLEGSVPMNIYGRVIWSKEVRTGLYENGIEYWEIKTEDEEKLIDHFCDKTSQDLERP